MRRPTSKMSVLATMLAMVFAMVSFQMPAHAAMMSTQDIVTQGELQGERERLNQFLLRDDVKSRLLDLGVNPLDVEKRIDSLTVSELAEINDKLDTLPAGGNGLGTVAVVLLILILLEIVGAIDIFPKL